MNNYLEYFNNLRKFVFRKDILEDILSNYGVALNNSEYTKLIKLHLSSGVIAKSNDSPGKCGYISTSFLAEQGVDAISYYKSLKFDGPNLVDLRKNIHFDDHFVKSDCIVNVPLKDVFNEL